MKLKFKNILLISLLAVAGIFSATAVAFNKQVNDQPVVEKAEAATTESKPRIYLYMTAKNNWTSATDPDVYIWNVTFDPSCKFSNLDECKKTMSSDTKYQFHDCATGGDDGIRGYALMHWVKNDGKAKEWYVSFPWFITGFQYKYKLHNSSWCENDGPTISLSTHTNGYRSSDYSYDDNNDCFTYTKNSNSSYDVNKYTLTFHTVGGTTVSAQNKLQYQKTDSVSAPTRTYSSFNGWALSSGTSFTPGTDTLEGDTDVYAQWTSNVTDTFSVSIGGSDFTNLTKVGDGSEISGTSNSVIWQLSTATTWNVLGGQSIQFKKNGTLLSYGTSTGQLTSDTTGGESNVKENASTHAWSIREDATLVDVYFKIISDGTYKFYIGKGHSTGASGDYIYFTPSARWRVNNPDFNCLFYKDGSQVSSSWMTKVNHSSYPGQISSHDTYYAKATAAFDQVQILRMNPSDHWVQWNYSGKSNVSSRYRWIVMTENCNWDDTWVCGDGSGTFWANLDTKLDWYSDAAAETGGDYSMASDGSTVRVFFYNTGSKWAGTASDVGYSAIRCWGGDASPIIGSSSETDANAHADASIYILTWFTDDNGTSYGFADIPKNISGYQFVLLDTNSSKYDRGIWNYQYQIKYEDDTYDIGGTFDKEDGCFTKIYYASGDSDKKWITISMGGAHDNVAGATLMKKLFKSIDTCSDSPDNGYKAADNINNYFYSHATNAAKSEITPTRNSGTYSTIYNLIQQYNAIKTRSDSNGVRGLISINNIFSIGNLENSLSTIIIIASSSVALLSVTALSILVIRKRKSKEIE